MIDSTNLYDGLETLWLGSADESLSNQQVFLYIFEFIYSIYLIRLLSNNDGLHVYHLFYSFV